MSLGSRREESEGALLETPDGLDAAPISIGAAEACKCFYSRSEGDAASGVPGGGLSRDLCFQETVTAALWERIDLDDSHAGSASDSLRDSGIRSRRKSGDDG